MYYGTPSWEPPVVGVMFVGASALAILLTTDAADQPSLVTKGKRWRIGWLMFFVAIYGTVLAQRSLSIPALLEIAVAVFSLTAATWTDLSSGRVSLRFLLPGIVAALALAALDGRAGPVGLSAAIGAIPFLGAALLTRGKAIGWGEVGLTAVGCLLLDFELAMALYTVCFVVGPLVAILRGRRKERLALAPYLSAAIALGVLLRTFTPVVA